MNRLRGVLVGAVVLAVVVSFGGAYPMTNTLLNNNDDGWFTTDNIGEYGDDLDERLERGERVFSGHPAYVIDSDDARLLFDRPRVHYFAVTFRGTELGDRQYQRIATALRNGSVPYAIDNDMTSNMLRWTGAGGARQAFTENYCLVNDVDSQRLYNKTDATLYEYVGNSTCPPDERPDVMD